MSDLSTKVTALQAAFDKLKTDTATGLADISAEVAALKNGQDDPAVLAQIDSITSSISDLDSTIAAADPGPAVPPATPAAPAA